MSSALEAAKAKCLFSEGANDPKNTAHMIWRDGGVILFIQLKKPRYHKLLSMQRLQFLHKRVLLFLF